MDIKKIALAVQAKRKLAQKAIPPRQAIKLGGKTVKEVNPFKRA